MASKVGVFPNSAYLKYLRSLVKAGKKCHMIGSNEKAISALITPVRIVYFNEKYRLNFYYQNFGKINSIEIDNILSIKIPSTGLV